MTASFILMLALFSAGHFPEVLPTFHPRAGALAGDSLAELTSPQQLIPAFCPSIFGTTDEQVTVTIPTATGLQVVTFLDTAWITLTAVGPCDTVDLCYAFPGLTNWEASAFPALSTIVERCEGATPYAFFQGLDPFSPDSCSATGFVVTDSSPDSGAAPHDPALVIPASLDGFSALSVWDPTTWDSFLFTHTEGDTSFTPDPTAWSSAIPRPDTCTGGPTPIAVGPLGEIAACVLAEAHDSLHIGLQPWLTISHDGGVNWDDLVLLPADAHGSALGNDPGRMPYGSFRGGTSWYGTQIVYADGIPLVFWTARRAPTDTVTAEELLWPAARAVLCSYPTNVGWQTTYVGRAMSDSSCAYDTADWPTVVLDNGIAVLLWSDLSSDGTNLDVWACAHDAGTGTWTAPATLTATPGSEAFLEATGPVTEDGQYALLCSDARLLYGEAAALSLLRFTLDPVWDAGTRTDVLPSPAWGSNAPTPGHLNVHITPNPATTAFTMLAPRGLRLSEATIFDLAGRQRLRIRDPLALQKPVPVAPLAPGIYVVRWRGGSLNGSLPLVVVR